MFCAAESGYGQSFFQNFLMVESQRGKFGKFEPYSLSCIIVSFYPTKGFAENYCAVSHGYNPFARIAVHIRKNANLFPFFDFQTRLFGKLARGTLFGCFVNIHETSGKSPLTFAGIIASFYQKQPTFA